MKEHPKSELEELIKSSSAIRKKSDTPENRAILIAYNAAAESDFMQYLRAEPSVPDKVYKFINQSEQGKDPLSDLDQLEFSTLNKETMILVLFGDFKKDILKSGYSYTLSGIISYMNEIEDTVSHNPADRITMEFLKSITSLIEPAMDSIVKQRTCYANIVEKAKELANEIGIKAEELVKQQSYRDEIIRRVFPTRNEADEHYNQRLQSIGKKSIEATKVFELFAKSEGLKFDVDLTGANDFVALQQEYNTKMLDRIYSA